MPMIGLMPASVAFFQKSKAPKTLPWSVVAMAGMPISRRGLEQVADAGGAVEHRVLAVHVQVDEGVRGAGREAIEKESKPGSDGP